MPIEPGLLNQPVVIEEATGQDEYGSQLIWTKVCATKADIQTATGSASTESKLYTGEARYAVTIRYRRGINTNQRIRFRSHKEDHLLMILWVERPRIAQPELLLLTCKEYE
jgi:head-tail adaptor